MDKKYGEYLASREWALKREAVKQRSGGICERCEIKPSKSVHHVSYAHLYNEPLEDLLDVCEDCHEYLSAKSSIDPTDSVYSDAVDAVRKIFLSIKPDNFEDEKRLLMCCPICGFEYLHFEEPEYLDYGQKISIRFWCENDHKFDLCFEFYKGNTRFFLQKSELAERLGI